MRVIVTLMLLLPLSGLAEQGIYYVWKDEEGVNNISAQPSPVWMPMREGSGVVEPVLT